MGMEELIVRHCSPTMAGLKTGNLFNFQAEDAKALASGIRRMNRQFVPRGIRLIPVRYRDGKAMIYMYRPSRLKADLAHRTARQILEEKDYPVSQADRCVVHLIHCLNHTEAFPHEIGLFLGYPPEDVEGFIRDGAAAAKYTGLWKVYGNVEAARSRFSQFKKCTGAYCEAFRKYHSFDRLIVSCS